MGGSFRHLLMRHQELHRHVDCTHSCGAAGKCSQQRRRAHPSPLLSWCCGSGVSHEHGRRLPQLSRGDCASTLPCARLPVRNATSRPGGVQAGRVPRLSSLFIGLSLCQRFVVMRACLACACRHVGLVHLHILVLAAAQSLRLCAADWRASRHATFAQWPWLVIMYARPIAASAHLREELQAGAAVPSQQPSVLRVWWTRRIYTSLPHMTYCAPCAHTGAHTHTVVYVPYTRPMQACVAAACCVLYAHTAAVCVHGDGGI